MKKHNHESFTESCPVCGLAPKLPPNALTVWGFEFLTQSMAPCVCGGAAFVELGNPKAYRIRCDAKCGIETKEHPVQREAVLEWNEKQIALGFDARKLHPNNQ